MDIFLHRHYIVKKVRFLSIQLVEVVPEPLQDCQHRGGIFPLRKDENLDLGMHGGAIPSGMFHLLSRLH